jgi:hypothetical protein
MMGVKLKIESKKDWLNLCWDLWKAGLLKDVTVNDVNLPEAAFPIEIPVQVEGLVKLLGNPLVKPYRKKIDSTLKENLARVIG